LIHVVAIFITALFPILPGNRPCVETSATDAVTYQTIAAYYGNGLGATYLRDPSGQRVSQLSLRTDNGSGGLHTMLANIRRYDGLNRLDSTAWNATEHVAGGTKALSYHGYQYNALDQRTRADLLDGTFWDFGYDDRGGVTRAEHKESGGTELAGQQFGFSYDGIGNRTAASDGTAASSLPNGYTPSVLNQYSQVGDSGTRHVLGKAPTTSTVTVNSAATTRQSEWFSSAIVADNTSGAVWQSVAVSDGTATVNGSLFIPAASVAPQYDADGNLTSDGRWNFTWDAENRLVGMEPTATALAAGVPYQRWAHIYDSNSRRIASERYDSVSAVTPDAVEKAVYDGWNRVAELDGSNAVLRTFAWGLDMTDSIHGGGGTGGLLWVDDVTHGKHFFGYDGNGNVALTVDAATGVPSAVYDYDPFGQVIRASGTYAQTNRYRFGTKQQGAGGFYDYGYRWLDPMTGRWLSRDPLGETGGLNLYGFLGNDGVNAWDLLGREGLNSEDYWFYNFAGWLDEVSAPLVWVMDEQIKPTAQRELQRSFDEGNVGGQIAYSAMTGFIGAGEGLATGGGNHIVQTKQMADAHQDNGGSYAAMLLAKGTMGLDWANSLMGYQMYLGPEGEFVYVPFDSMSDQIYSTTTSGLVFGGFLASGGYGAQKGFNGARQVFCRTKNSSKIGTKARFGTKDSNAIAEFDSVTGEISYNRANIRAEAASKGTTWRHEARVSAFHEHGHKLLNPVNNAVKKIFGLSEQPYFRSQSWLRVEEAVVELYGQVRARVRTFRKSTK